MADIRYFEFAYLTSIFATLISLNIFLSIGLHNSYKNLIERFPRIE